MSSDSKAQDQNNDAEKIANMPYDDEPLSDKEMKGIKESLEDIRTGRVYAEEVMTPSKNLCLGDPVKFKKALEEIIEKNREGLIRLGKE